MFHIVYKILKSVIIPVIFIIAEAEVRKRKRQEYLLIELCGKWFCFWAIGFGGFSAGLMQAFNPAYTASLLDVQISDMILIRELGWAQAGIGLIGLLSVRFIDFRKPAAISYGVFILGAAVLHLTRLGSTDFSEIVSLADDILIIAVAVFVILQRKGKRILRRNDD